MSHEVKVFTKSVAGEKPYTVKWTRWLKGAAIASSTWYVESGLTSGTGAKAPSHDGSSSVIWLSGGKLGDSYLVTNTVTTDETLPRTESRTFRVKIDILGS